MRRTFMLLAVAFAGLTTGGCAGDGKAKVKGRLVSNNQPMSFPPTQAAVILSPVGADGKPDPARAFTAVVNEDGSFEVLASGGELPAGTYQVSILAKGDLGAKLKAFSGTASPVRRELKPGSNEITIDVAKPDGG